MPSHRQKNTIPGWLRGWAARCCWCVMGIGDYVGWPRALNGIGDGKVLFGEGENFDDEADKADDSWDGPSPPTACPYITSFFDAFTDPQRGLVCIVMERCPLVRVRRTTPSG